MNVIVDIYWVLLLLRPSVCIVHTLNASTHPIIEMDSIALTQTCEKTKRKSRNRIEKCESHFVTMHSTCAKPRKSVAPIHLMLFFSLRNYVRVFFFFLHSIHLPASIYRHNNALHCIEYILYWIHTIHNPHSHKVIE